MAIIAFLMFTVVFCYLMNKWSHELEQELQSDSQSAVAGATRKI